MKNFPLQLTRRPSKAERLYLAHMADIMDLRYVFKEGSTVTVQCLSLTHIYTYLIHCIKLQISKLYNCAFHILPNKSSRRCKMQGRSTHCPGPGFQSCFTAASKLLIYRKTIYNIMVSCGLSMTTPFSDC